MNTQFLSINEPIPAPFLAHRKEKDDNKDKLDAAKEELGKKSNEWGEKNRESHEAWTKQNAAFHEAQEKEKAYKSCQDNLSWYQSASNCDGAKYSKVLQNKRNHCQAYV
jgi:hypothetical protein